LASDVDREVLLQEERDLMALQKQPNLTEAQLKDLDVRLGKVYAALAEISADDADANARAILSGLGFTSEMQAQPTKEFSGGWRMRVSLARALFCNPDVLLLDEPTNMLGPSSLLAVPFLVVESERVYGASKSDIHQRSLRKILSYFKRPSFFWCLPFRHFNSKSRFQHIRAEMRNFPVCWFCLRASNACLFLLLRSALFSCFECFLCVDVRAVLWLETYLKTKWTHTLLVVSHDREFLNDIATDIIHLNSEQLTYYTGNYDAYVRARTEKMKNVQRMAEAQANQKKHVQAFIDRFRYNANRAALVQSRIKKLEKMEVLPEMVEDQTIAFTFPPATPLRPPIIQFNDVSFGYTPEKILFKDLNFNIDMESRVALVGENGQGKTTILNLIAGELQATSGLVFRHGRLRMAKFSQHHVDQLDLSLTPVQWLQVHHPGKEFQEYRAWLGKYGIQGDLAGQKIETLSGGQKSRVVFAHMAMLQPQIMVLDEVVNHLDIETVDALANALNEYTGGIVLISHDERLISLVCDEVWIVHDGSVRKYEVDFDSYKAKVLRDLGFAYGN
jgi:ATPase subunit of ABC transporter with duplicated ATPase domains